MLRVDPSSLHVTVEDDVRRAYVSIDGVDLGDGRDLTVLVTVVHDGDQVMLVPPSTDTLNVHREIAIAFRDCLNALFPLQTDPVEIRPPIDSGKGTKSTEPCAKCGALDVWVQEINDYPDYRITCHTCQHSYCVDGPDA